VWHQFAGRLPYSRQAIMTRQTLPADKVRTALARIVGWRMASAEPVACPVCEAPGLAILDQSARPYAEWYALSCAACGLKATINVPLGPPVPGSDA
jgi:hypothetical protein